LLDLNELLIQREDFRVTIIVRIFQHRENFSRGGAAAQRDFRCAVAPLRETFFLNCGRDFYKARVKNTRQTSRLFGGLEFSLRVDNHYTSLCPVQRNRQLSQLGLDLNLPERAQVQSTTPERHVRTPVSKQQ